MTDKNEHRVSKELKKRARKYLKGHDFANTKLMGEHLDIPPRTAGAVFRKLKWKKWSKTPTRTTYHRPGIFTK